MTTNEFRIAENYQRVHQRIAATCRRSGRELSSVKLVAVTKSACADWVDALIQHGVSSLGESRPQQLVERAPLFPNHIEWHLIGHLQRNKVRPVLPVAKWIQSIDSVRLLDRIASLASQMHLRPRLLLEVNVSDEPSKDGFAPAELEAVWERIHTDRRVRIEGLMTLAPLVSNPEATRPVFRGLRELFHRLNEQSRDGCALSELSMGMSNDFEIAIEEGATMVRVGSRLFEGLAP